MWHALACGFRPRLTHRHSFVVFVALWRFNYHAELSIGLDNVRRHPRFYRAIFNRLRSDPLHPHSVTQISDFCSWFSLAAHCGCYSDVRRSLFEPTWRRLLLGCLSFVCGLVWNHSLLLLWISSLSECGFCRGVQPHR